jgi:hypothetical protein
MRTNKALAFLTALGLAAVTAPGVAFAQASQQTGAPYLAPGVPGTSYPASPSALGPVQTQATTNGTFSGEVATRAQLPSGTNPATTIMSGTWHVAKQRMVYAPQVAFANFYVLPGSGEKPMGGIASITTTIEYPVGTFTRLTYGGQVTGTIPDGSYKFTDANIKLAAVIPAGARFRIRRWQSNPAGVTYTAFNVNVTTATGDATNLVSGQPDLTGGGTITDGGIGFIESYPVAIIAPTTLPSVCFFGDSRAEGLADIRNDASGDGGELARFIGAGYPYISMAIPSDLITGTLASVSNPTAMVNRLKLVNHCTTVIDEYGINDINAGVTAANVAAARATAAALFPNQQVWGTTLAPETSSTDSWATMAKQTASAATPVINAFNALVRTGIAGEVNFIDIADAIDPGRTGMWPLTGVAGAITPEGLHETAAAALIERRSGAWNGISFTQR